MTPNTRTACLKKIVYRLWRGTHTVIWRVPNYTIEIHNWNQAGKNNNIALSGTPSQPQTTLGMRMSLRKSLLQLLRMYLSQQYVYNNKYRLRTRTHLIHYIRHNHSPPVWHVISKTSDKKLRIYIIFLLWLYSSFNWSSICKQLDYVNTENIHGHCISPQAAV